MGMFTTEKVTDRKSGLRVFCQVFCQEIQKAIFRGQDRGSEWR